MSVTRRAYYLGTWLYVALEALVYGAVLLSELELAGRVREDRPGAAAEASAAFGTPVRNRACASRVVKPVSRVR